MKQCFILSSISAIASAFPAYMNGQHAPNIVETLTRRQLNSQDALGLSRGQSNCGFSGPCLTFSESQLVSTSGANAWAAPGLDEIRGPCPGLNAAANHGYLPRSGIVSLEESTSVILYD